METKDGDTIEEVSYKLLIKSDAPLEKLQRCHELTEKSCHVGNLFVKAGVPITHTLEVI